MGAITLVRQQHLEISDADKVVVRRVLFGIVDGLGDTGRRQWRRFFAMLLRLAPGELLEIRTHKDRSGPFHRRHMLLESRVFDAQETFEHFKQFRDWLKIGAGHCDWFPGPDGTLVPLPRSIDFDSVEEGEMREIHDAMLRFLRSGHAVQTLWPALPEPDRELAIDGVLLEFGE